MDSQVLVLVQKFVLKLWKVKPLIIWMLQLKRVTGCEVPTPYAKELEDFAFPDTEVILRACKKY